MIDLPNIIPPRSLVELISADEDTPRWKQRIGKIYRIGYYSPQDGLDTIWLVDENGNYCETTDHDYLAKYFRIIKLCNTKNYFGYRCKPIGPIKEDLVADPGL
jgi:hypothetical protein